MGSRLPEPNGMRLWRMLHDQTLGRLALVVDGDVDRGQLEHWMKVNGVKAAVYDVLETTDPQIKAEKVHRLLGATGPNDWYFDVDPQTAAITLSLGIPTILVSVPYVIRPEWSSESQARSWGTLVDEIDKQQIMRAERDWNEPMELPE
jgi:hypothetical protein